MPNMRNMPKWLAFLIPLTLSLALLSAAGCSSDDDKVVERPKESQETGIANITISAGVLEPAFREDVRNYGVSTFYTATPDFRLTVTVNDPKSRLFIAGQERNSGQATTIALNPEGDTTIQISVQAEDGKNFNLVTLTAKVMPLNTTVCVYDSLGGNYLDGAKITLRDARTNELLASDIAFPFEAQGTVFLGLDKTRRYNIYARRDDTAMACFADFDPSREDTVTLYSRKDWVKDLPASAPIVTDVAFASIPSGSLANTVWKSLPPGANQVSDIPANLYLLRVTAIAESDINMNEGRGAIMVNIDDTASPYQERVESGGYWEHANTPVIVNDKRYMMTDTVFSMSSVMPMGEHFLDIVIYDWANNRTEQRVYLSVANTATTADRDFRAFTPYWYAHRSWTAGISTNPYSTGPVDEYIAPIALMAVNDPVGPYGDTIYVYYEFDFRESAPNGATVNGFRGYELERATSDSGPWRVVRKRAYTSPSSNYFVNGYDYSPELIGGATYYYRFRFYNNTGYSQYSDVHPITIMPSFNVNLVSPANQAQSNTLLPAFRFKVTNDALLDEEMVGYGRFTLYVRNKIGQEVIKARFQVDYRALDEEGNPTITIQWPFLAGNGGVWHNVYPFDENGEPILDEAFVWIEDDGIICIDTKLADENFGNRFTLADFEPGASYEWNIFGDQASAAGNWSSTPTYSMYFYKLHAPNYRGVDTNYSYSYASTPLEGSGAVNGYFTLIMHPDAE